MFNSNTNSTYTSNYAVLADSIRAKYESAIATGTFNQRRYNELQNAIKLQVEPIARKLEYYFHSDDLRQIIAMATKRDLLYLIDDEARYLRKKNHRMNGVFKLTPFQMRNIRKRVDALNFVFHSRKEELFIQYEETVLYRQLDVYCPVCGQKMEFRKGLKFNAYYCPSNDHNVMVSCHPHTAMPTGIAATLPTRIKRTNLHMLVDQVFKGRQKELHEFLERMIGRELNVYDGHIGSMDGNECDRMISLFQFLNKRAGYLELLKKTNPNDYILEEHFLATATHREMQVYYLWVTSDSKEKVMRIFNVAEHEFIEFMRPMIEKGMPCGNLKISLNEREKLIKELTSNNFKPLF